MTIPERIAKAIDRFDEAARVWGWQEDQGSDGGVIASAFEEYQFARADLEAAILAAEQRGAASSQQAEPVAWAYEFHDFGDVWARHVILNRRDGGANPPTKHYGSKIRNVIPLYASPSPASDSTRVAVKPLEWVEGPPGTETFEAITPWGSYVIWEIGGSGCWTSGPMPGAYAGNNGIASAKAAVQADHERRILSALQFTDQKNDGEETSRSIGIGMAMAAGIIMACWGDETHARQILTAAGFNSVQDLIDGGVDEYDINLLRPALQSTDQKGDGHE